MSLPTISLNASINVRRIPFRLRVQKALTQLLETINPDNGYVYDMRGSVFRGRVRYGDDDPIPMISILEAPIPAEVNVAKKDGDGSFGIWELLIQGFVDDDKNNPTDPAHDLMAEVKSVLVKSKVLTRGQTMLDMDGRVDEMSIGQGSVRPPDEASDKAFFWLTLTLTIAEQLSDPYT